MEIIEIDSFFPDYKPDMEKFQQQLDSHDWSRYEGKFVLVKGCGKMLIPMWAYMFVTARLVGRCQGIAYGEPHKPIIVWKAGSQ